MSHSPLRSSSFVRLSAAALFCVMVVGLSASTAWATQGWSQGVGQTPLKMKDLVPEMSSGMAYTERYSFAVDLDGGGHVGVDFTISNLGFGDGKGGVNVRVHGFPGQKKYNFSDSMRQSKWSYARDRFMLKMGKTSVQNRGEDTFVLKHDDGDVKFELAFKNNMPMWRPGNGRIDVKDGYYKFNLIAPRADVTGRLFIGGKWHEVKGTRKGYGDHVSTNVAPYNFAKRFSRFRNYNGDLFVIWREIQLEGDYGGQSVTWVMVGYRDQIVFASPDAKIRFGKLSPDRETGYQVPYNIQIDAKNGADTFSLVMRGKKLKKQDLLDHYGTAAKLVASAVSKPYRYTVNCDYAIKMTVKGKTVTLPGQSHFTLDFVNP